MGHDMLLIQAVQALREIGYTVETTPAHHPVRYINKNAKAVQATESNFAVLVALDAMTQSHSINKVNFQQMVDREIKALNHDVIYIEEAVTVLPPAERPGFAVSIRVYSFARADQHNPTEDLKNFGEALAAIESGLSVRRAGWNGKNQYVYKENFDGLKFEPCFVLFNAQGQHQTGWVPSMGDLRAKDWEILSE